MKKSVLANLRCLVCRQEGKLGTAHEYEEGVEILEGELSCRCGQKYSIQKGIANFTYPERLLPLDEEFRQKYDQGAGQYEIGLEWLFKSFFEDENSVRSKMVDLLEIQPGFRVLDVGCGTGRDSLHIARQLESKGELYVQDISLEMLGNAKRNLAMAGVPVEYFLGNASYLPFADRFFDAVFHFGGLNAFGEKRKALSEMTRVVRIGGKIIVGDEAVAPWLRRKLYGRVLVKANPLYKHSPPLDCLPPNAQNVTLRWILGNAFYLIEYRAGGGPPQLDMDLPIPGKGDTLRSRYYGAKVNG